MKLKFQSQREIENSNGYPAGIVSTSQQDYSRLDISKVELDCVPFMLGNENTEWDAQKSNHLRHTLDTP